MSVLFTARQHFSTAATQERGARATDPVFQFQIRKTPRRPTRGRWFSGPGASERMSMPSAWPPSTRTLLFVAGSQMRTAPSS